MTFASFQSYQGPTDATSEGPAVQVRSRDEGHSVSITDGRITEARTQADRATTAELNPHHGTEHFGASAVNPNGLPVTELLPDTLVTIDGVQAPVSFWVDQGRIAKGADGTYSEVQAQPEEAPKVDTSDVLPIESATMDRINAALDPVPQEDLDSLIAVGQGVATGRLDFATLAQKFAQVSGQSPTETASRLDVLVGAYTAQTEKALTAPGVLGKEDLPGFYEWARRNRQGDMRAALEAQLRTHDMKGWKALADTFKTSTAPSLQALRAAGVPVRTEGGVTEAYIRGQWMSPGAAARAGLI